MSVSLVVAMAENRVIGRGGSLPWHLPNDLKKFKALTWGHTIVMGRKTFQSIGRLLPGRTTVILTRDPKFTPPQGALVAHDLPEAIDRFGKDSELFVVGGEAVYRAALPLAQRMYLTQVHAQVPGDVYFPPYNEAEWRLVSEEPFPADERHEFPYCFRTYERATA